MADSQHIRLSAEAILAWARGQTDLIWAELDKKLEPLAVKLGAPKVRPPSWSNGFCVVHRNLAMIEDGDGLVCPEPGCDYRAGFSEAHGEGAKMFHEEVAKRTQEAHATGGSGGGSSRRRKKPSKKPNIETWKEGA
jgi:hypothetical protein